VLSNLLTNAIKYSPAGGPVEVTLLEEIERQEALINIRDQGIGIPKEEQAHLFGRFVWGTNGQAHGISGTGLGLYLCRELVEQHGGTPGSSPSKEQARPSSSGYPSCKTHPLHPKRNAPPLLREAKGHCDGVVRISVRLI
jgi:signal transduction histidine kinase